jgi:hypothetical protein
VISVRQTLEQLTRPLIFRRTTTFRIWKCSVVRQSGGRVALSFEVYGQYRSPFADGSSYASQGGRRDLGYRCKYWGTSKNRRYCSDAAKLPANDSVSFSFRFMDVHSGAARDRYREQFLELPIRLSFFNCRPFESVQRSGRTWPQSAGMAAVKWEE